MNAQDWRALLPHVSGEYVEQAVLWCQDIVDCLVKYAGEAREEAEQFVRASYIIEFLNEDVHYVFRDKPYYWAMTLLYGRANPQWYQDKTLWPPPNDYHGPYH